VLQIVLILGVVVLVEPVEISLTGSSQPLSNICFYSQYAFDVILALNYMLDLRREPGCIAAILPDCVAWFVLQ